MSIKSISKNNILLLCLCLLLSVCVNSNNVKNNKQIKKTNFGIIISGPSGAGKTTILHELLKKYPNELVASVSATTRLPRKGEVDGVDYYFLDINKFKELASKDEFIEYAEVYNHYYGSPSRNYIEAVENGKIPIFVLSTDGMLKAKKKKNMHFITIFVKTSNEKELYYRLLNRGTETKEQIMKRFNNANLELNEATKYDYIVYNDNLEKAIKNIEAIYFAEKYKYEISK